MNTWAIVEAMKDLGLLVENVRKEWDIEILSRYPRGRLYPQTITRAILSLWADRGFRECYRRRNKYQLDDNFEYYVNSINPSIPTGCKRTP